MKSNYILQEFDRVSDTWVEIAWFCFFNACYISMLEHKKHNKKVHYRILEVKERV